MQIKYTQKDFQDSLKWAIILTMISFMEYTISSFWVLVDFLDTLRVMVLLFGAFCMPIIVIIGWFRCIKRYLYLEFGMKDKTDITKSLWRTCVCIAIIIGLGVIVFYRARDIVDYLADNLNILDGLQHCIAIKIAIFMGWFGLWIYSLVRRKAMCVKGGLKAFEIIIGIPLVIVLVIVLVLASIQSDVYAYEQGEDVFLQKMMEYVREHMDDYTAERFSRNKIRFD